MNRSFFGILKFILSLSLIIICIFNSWRVIYQLVNPELPMIQVYKKSLLDLEFPLYFSICFSELENEENRYTNLGYNGPFPWFVGQSMYKKSHFGWNGHTKNGKTLATVDGKSFSLPKIKIIIKIKLIIFRNSEEYIIRLAKSY